MHNKWPLFQTMVRDYNFPLEIRTVQLFGKKTDLAKSSRNVYLSEQERKEAPAIYRGTAAGERGIFINSKDAEKAIGVAKEYILKNTTTGRIDYLNCYLIQI